MGGKWLDFILLPKCLLIGGFAVLDCTIYCADHVSSLSTNMDQDYVCIKNVKAPNS